MRPLVVCAVQAEAVRAKALAQAHVVVSGVGRTNAAIATTRAILKDGPFDAVLSLGVAGALPGCAPPLLPGAVVVASESVYHEEGLHTPDGFQDMTGLGFPLGDFEGNRVPADPRLLDSFRVLGRCAPIATVASCSGTDASACEVQARTGAIAEAMEGAAVLHAAAHFDLPGIEVRVISNTTGDRPQQIWKLNEALDVLGDSMPAIAECLSRR